MGQKEAERSKDTHDNFWPVNQLRLLLYFVLEAVLKMAAAGPDPSGSVWFGKVPTSQASYLCIE